MADEEERGEVWMWLDQHDALVIVLASENKHATRPRKQGWMWSYGTLSVDFIRRLPPSMSKAVMDALTTEPRKFSISIRPAEDENP